VRKRAVAKNLDARGKIVLAASRRANGKYLQKNEKRMIKGLTDSPKAASLRLERGEMTYTEGKLMMASQRGISRGMHRVLAVSALIGFLGVAADGYSQIYTLSDLNSSAQVNTASQSGMFNWVVDGHNVLSQQWFWLGIGSTAPKSIDQIGIPTVSQPIANLLDTVYSSSQYSVGIEYLLSGSSPGSGASDLGESITLSNASAAPLVFHFYEYSDFNLGPLQTVQLGKNLQGRFNLADVNGGDADLSETVATPGANHGEAELAGVTLAKLNNGILPVTLNDADTAAGPGPHTTWAFEWDVTINPGAEYLISKDKTVQIVPEPGSMALCLLGISGLVARKRR
jgi:hypothetical protein